MQNPVIERAGEMFFLVEEMKRLIAQQSDMWMFRQKIMQRRRARLLHARDHKVDVIDFAPPKEEEPRSGGVGRRRGHKNQ